MSSRLHKNISWRDYTEDAPKLSLENALGNNVFKNVIHLVNSLYTILQNKHLIHIILINVLAKMPIYLHALKGVPGFWKSEVQPKRKITFTSTQRYKMNILIFQPSLIKGDKCISNKKSITYTFNPLRLSDAVKHAIIASDNGLSPGRHQVIIWTNAGILWIKTLGKNLSEILKVKFIHFHSRKCIWKCHLWNGGQFVSASMG